MVKVQISDELVDREAETLTALELAQMIFHLPPNTPITFKQGYHYQITGGTQRQVIDDDGNETQEIEQFILHGW